MLFHHTEVQKAISFFAGTFKNTRKFTISIKEPIYTLHLLSSVEIRLFDVFFWERKTGFGIVTKKLNGMPDSREKGAGMRDQAPPSRPCLNWTTDPTMVCQAQSEKNIKSTEWTVSAFSNTL